MKTLLLDAAYQPVSVICWTRAMILLIQGKATVLHEYEDVTINSASQSWKLPSVMVYAGKLVKRKRKSTFSRFAIYYRDKWTCQYCNTKHEPKYLTFDHVVPRRLGGKTTWTNIVACCRPCNLKKADKRLPDSGMKLLKEPVELKEAPPVMIQINKSDPEEWRNYIYWNSELASD